MSTNKEFTRVANQLSVLAKAYFNALQGTPEEIAKQQKDLLKYVKGLHRQLRTKGTKMVKVAPVSKGKKGTASFLEEEYGCPSGMVKCADGSCVPKIECCEI